MARESQLWDSLSKAKFVFKERLHMHRVENPVSPGMPDVEGFLEAMSQFWFELKSAARPANAPTPIRFKMRPKQVEWARRRWAIGGACYWLLQVGSGSARKVYMLEGDQGARIEAGMTEEQIAQADILDGMRFDPCEAIQMAFR